jgi:predicted kinase
MSTLYVIRGLPGSGKSTEARRLLEQNPHMEWYEADMYFSKITGTYQFDHTKLGQAHSECIRLTDEALSRGLDVIVSNTFSTLKELKPYQELSIKHKAKLDIRQMNHDFISIHNVPEDTIKKMKVRWQEYPNCVQISK